MKILIACCLLVGCTDHQNLGNDSGLLAHTRWAITLGDIDADDGRGVAIDLAGDVVAGGYFTGTVDFGVHTLTAPQGGGWLSKRAGADGHELWTLGFTSDQPGSGEILDLGTSDDGSVIVNGSFTGDLQLETQVLHDGGSFVAKYDPSGHLQWARSVPASTDTALAVGHDGRSALVGRYAGTIQFPNGGFTATDYQDPFVILFDTDGQPTWGAVGIGGAPTSVAMTGEDDVIVNGNIGSDATFAGSALRANSRESQFVARFTVDGTLLWASTLGAEGVSQEAGPIAIDANGGAIITSTRMVDLNGQPKIDALDPNGHALWTSDAVSGSAIAKSATVMADGTVVTGGTGSPIDFGSGSLHGCMYLAAYDPAGEFVDARSYMDPTCGLDIPWKLASRSGSLAFTGVIGEPADFGTGTLRFAGTTDAMIVMIDTTP
jgi:hypothetical protein